MWRDFYQHVRWMTDFKGAQTSRCYTGTHASTAVAWIISAIGNNNAISFWTVLLMNCETRQMQSEIHNTTSHGSSVCFEITYHVTWSVLWKLEKINLWISCFSLHPFSGRRLLVLVQHSVAKKAQSSVCGVMPDLHGSPASQPFTPWLPTSPPVSMICIFSPFPLPC